MQLGMSVESTPRHLPDYITDLAVYELEGKEDPPNDEKADKDALVMEMVRTTDICALGCAARVGVR